MTNSMTLEKNRLSFKAQTIAAIIAIIGAVAVPQIFHVIGDVSGLGTALGATFLPMHLPIILVGLLAGPYAGAVSGLLGPLASFALSGMPTSVMLPFMMIELCAYGLFAGLLRSSRLPVIVKVLISQAVGRIIRAGAILIAVYAFGSSINIATIWKSVPEGLFGLVLQWSLLPLIIYRVENMKSHEK